MNTTPFHPRTSLSGFALREGVALLVVLALAGVGYWLYSTGRIFGGGQPPAAPAPAARGPGAAGGSPQPPGTSGSATRRADAPGGESPDLRGTVFDMDAPSTPRKSPGDGRPDPLARRAAERAAAAQGLQRARLDEAEARVRASRAKLEQARRDAEQKAKSPAVKAARAEIRSAEAEVKRLRAASAGGTSAMVAASQRSMAAKTKLRNALDSAASSNGDVVDAQADLKRAEAALRAARTGEQCSVVPERREPYGIAAALVRRFVAPET